MITVHFNYFFRKTNIMINNLLTLNITSILQFALGLLGISILIAFHELGHFLFCKLFSVKTPSFSIGFGPRILTKKIGDTEFALSAIPFGGYVEIAGMTEVGQGEQLHREEKGSSSFAQKPYYQQFLILMGGIIFNFLFTYIAFSYLNYTGIPANSLLPNKASRPVVAVVIKETPAARSGLKETDTILSVNGNSVQTTFDFMQILNNNVAPSVILSVKEKETDSIKEIVIYFGQDSTLNDRKRIGIHFQNDAVDAKPFIAALKQGAFDTYFWTWAIISDFLFFFKRGDFRHISGPVAMIGLAGQTAMSGCKMLLILLALISANLALLNLVPFPILDGGQLLFYTIEAIIGRPLPNRVREIIHILTWILFLLLFALLTFRDIMKFFR